MIVIDQLGVNIAAGAMGFEPEAVDVSALETIGVANKKVTIFTANAKTSVAVANAKKSLFVAEEKKTTWVAEDK